MIGLYLLAHMVGDFVLQTRWQAAGKIDDRPTRLRHVLGYCVPFVPIAAIYGQWWGPGNWTGPEFMLLLGTLHFATDSRRFHSTLGDVIAWWLPPWFVISDDLYVRRERDKKVFVRPRDVKLEPNPWPPMPILVDQTLHVCQLALLGGLFLT